MDAVVLGLLVASVVDAAASHDDHVAVGADVEVIVDQLVQAGLGDDDGNVDGLVLGAVFNINVDAGLFGVFLGDDLDVLRAAPGL